METLDVAFKDLKRAFRSPFALVMMFGAPLLIAALLYFAFGGLATGDGSFTLPRTRLVVANLDAANALGSQFKAGQMLVDFLQNEELSDVLEIRLVADEESARSAVETRQVDTALIIPANFTQAAMTPDQDAAVTLYQDPTLTIGPGIVKDLVNHYMDGFSGAKIAARVSVSGADAPRDAAQRAAQQYAAYLNSSSHDAALRAISPAGENEQAAAGATLIGPIMAGMLVMFVFFMGGNQAQSIIEEHEGGTLARLFTTPASQLKILGGKFLGVFVALGIQTVVLLAVSGLLFRISWGGPLAVALTTLGLIVAATGFGVMLMSLIKNSRQTGPVLGGVITLTGMIGGLFSTAMPNLPKAMETISLSMPQGWALRGLELCLAGATTGEVLLPTLVLAALGTIFFLIGFSLFRKRFA
jgi:ABC-2 type transport system permease protein